MNGLLLTDGYKTGHHKQYPEGTEEVYSNWTPRSNKYAPQGCDKVVSFGQQFVMMWLHDYFADNFFSKPKAQVCTELKTELSLYLDTDYDISHFEELHDLQYLPIRVKSLPEGTEVPIRVPMVTVVNTRKEFYWVTNFLETILTAMLWQPMTSATIAINYKRIFKKWALKTDKENLEFIDFQGHDFSMRGMGGLQSAQSSGMGHATVFLGSDTLPVISGLRKYYQAEGFVIGSVNATEHSVMCAGTKTDEIGTFQHLINTYPKGILSVVSDTWDLWKVLTEYLPKLKEEILSRDGKLVRAEQICSRLHQKGFASTNVVLGIGSFTYQFNTRDTFGFAMKATSVVVNGERREIYKDPITDDGIKKSAKGLVKVEQIDGEYMLIDQVDKTQEQEGELRIIYENGKFINTTNLSEIRSKINSSI